MRYDVIIIGSGVAGLSAAIYAERARLNTLVIENQPLSGGQIINTYEVDNYPGLPGISGFELAQKFREHADRLGMKIVTEEFQNVTDCGKYKTVTTASGTYEGTAVLFAQGATHRKLGCPGEETFSGMGVSYCATCDGAFFRKKITAVVGGGDVALEDALFLARGCEKVYLIHRRGEFRGAKSLQEQVLHTENIEILYHTQVKEILGDGKVTGIEIYNNQTETTEVLEAAGVFIAVGIEPNTAMLEGVVELDQSGYIVAGEDGVTSTAGFFAAGDIRTKMLRQIVTAAADGANAIYSVNQYLNSDNFVYVG